MAEEYKNGCWPKDVSKSRAKQIQKEKPEKINSMCACSVKKKEKKKDNVTIGVGELLKFFNTNSGI